jgi:hypothetical protein
MRAKEIYVVLAMVIVHKPRLRLYFSQNQLVAITIYNHREVLYIIFKN